MTRALPDSDFRTVWHSIPSGRPQNMKITPMWVVTAVFSVIAIVLLVRNGSPTTILMPPLIGALVLRGLWVRTMALYAFTIFACVFALMMAQQ